MTRETVSSAKEPGSSVGASTVGPVEFSRSLDEPDWLTAFRSEAYTAYREIPVPLRADHLWRYSDPVRYEPATDPFRTPETAPLADWPEDVAPALSAGDLAGAALVGGGDGARVHLEPEVARAGVLLTDLQTAARQHPELLRKLLGRLVTPTFGRFEALNAAAFRDGILLRIPRGVALEKPIHLVRAVDAPGYQADRLCVLVEEGASATVIHELEDGPAGVSAQLSSVAEIEVEAGGRLQLVTVQTVARKIQVFQTWRVRVGRGAMVVPVIASFGGGEAKVDGGVLLQGEGASSAMTGFLSAVGRQRFDHHTVHHHTAPHTSSNLDFKTVLKDRSRSAYTGLIRIEEQADYSEAYQENRNLLLNEGCRADSIPELEIMTEEVQCKHGATVGPLDRNHLFYLMSRAIPRDEAVRIIVEGHFESALVRLPAVLQGRLREMLRERLRVI